MTSLSVITINIDPNLHLGPVTVAWHGLPIAIGILVGGLAAARLAPDAASTSTRSTPSAGSSRWAASSAAGSSMC
jgi:prolipoprotein diacylglyceryltransferase